ncbi:MAG: hypothetical protein Q9222_002701 [Ikaeria aurantiellina]
MPSPLHSTLTNIYIRIRHPPRPSPNTPIIIYFTPGVSIDALSNPDYAPSTTLSLTAHATTIHITPRSSPYPQPIHDTLAAYDWIRTHLLPHHPNPPPQIATCGSLLGGSLATTLALTECSPTGITACAVHNPIADWSTPFPPPQNQRGKALTSLRATSFAKSEHRYDPFASPLLFFRTPAFELPPPPSPFASVMSPTSSQDKADAGSDLVQAKRRYHRTYPPLDSGLRIPKTRVLVGREFALKDQVVELAELMQRSVDLHEKDGDARQEEANRISIAEFDGDGLGWEEKEVMEVGEWLGQGLRER